MMKMIATSLAAALLLTAGTSGVAQTTTETKVDNDTSVKDGVATTRHKVTHTTKHKTHRPKKVLGVKVGHETETHKTVRETSTSSNGDSSTTVKTN